ncbi:esterase-like activity of phytase family protein [Plesiomonas shigelloides]|uniref:esterase-like activity of phytase family protein n=1 Tax=Plesiomonas shigelloides TaxID=703 RepID=UPI002117AA07|nr:esterase-like activity of phytase family protein [Plesiomonas shigelloides]MCQ8859430.1 esterase-like activity of phytase family protein [Plesiomonas shigelloides]
MKLKPLFLFFASALPLLSQAADLSVERYTVSFPAGDRVSYNGAFAKNFPQGLPVGIGSGLVFNGVENGDLLFTTVTDRGPNADAPSVGKQEAKIFANPAFVPLLMDIRISKNQAIATDARPLHDNDGPVSGLPLPSTLIGSTNEAALSDTLQPVSSDPRGLDTEGITPDGKGGFWLSDEYGPFLIHIDQQGKILEKYAPTPAAGEQGVATGLPNILKWRQPNRGFEGVTRLPNGQLLVAVQSTLDIEGKSKNTAQFTRLMSFDPTTGKTAMYGYPIDVDSYKKAKDAKIGDIVALDNQHILLVEQGSDKDKQMINKIYLVDLTNASDLAAFDSSGTAPEFDDAKTLAKRGIKLAQKREIADLRKLGWQHEKVEGLALIDNQRIAILNDNDFGLQPKLINAEANTKKITDYQVNEQGKLNVDGKPVATTLELHPLEQPESLSELWVITLPEALR